MRGLLFLSTLALALAACNNNNAAREQQDSIRINRVTPGQTMKLAGTYQGTLPCADCPGIDYQISLYDDSTYSELTAYQGRGENIATVETGTWRAINDSIAMLEKKNDSISFVAAENKLILLDKAGKRIEGMLASNYILKPVEGGDRRQLLGDKKTQGVTFFANGNEPFWTLELDKKNIRFKTVGGDSIYTPLPGLALNTDTLKVYKGKGITINIRPTTCADDMSGYLRPNTVQLLVGEKTYSGCGEFIK